jgi:hypothetical protein
MYLNARIAGNGGIVDGAFNNPSMQKGFAP